MTALYLNVYVYVCIYVFNSDFKLPGLPQMTARGLHRGQGLRNSPRAPAEPCRPRCLARDKHLAGRAPPGKSLGLGVGEAAGAEDNAVLSAPAATLLLASGVPAAVS